MKSKKLLALIIVVALLIVITVVLISVFSVASVRLNFHKFYGAEMTAPDGAPSANEVLKLCKGKNIMFLSKEDLLAKLNKKFPNWHAYEVVKNFPNRVEVHFVENVPVVKMNLGSVVYLNSFGYVVPAPENGVEPIDITSAILVPSTSKVSEMGKKYEFVTPERNEQLSAVIKSVLALYQCQIDIEDIPEVLGKVDVFTFESDGDLVIRTKAGAQIVVKSPKPNDNLTERLIDAFSVYCNPTQDLQKEGVVITVTADGKILSK